MAPISSQYLYITFADQFEMHALSGKNQPIQTPRSKDIVEIAQT